MNLPEFLSGSVGPEFWVIGGLILLGISLVVPEPTIVALGFAGLVTAAVAISITEFTKQLLVWGILTLAFTLIIRGLVPRNSKSLEHDKYAQVSEAIPPGGMGHVSYEGSIWSARAQISDVAISPGQKVSVVGRQGNILIVVPIPPVSDITTG